MKRRTSVMRGDDPAAERGIYNPTRPSRARCGERQARPLGRDLHRELRAPPQGVRHRADGRRPAQVQEAEPPPPARDRLRAPGPRKGPRRGRQRQALRRDERHQAQRRLPPRDEDDRGRHDLLPVAVEEGHGLLLHRRRGGLQRQRALLRGAARRSRSRTWPTSWRLASTRRGR